jgi:ATP-dependent RNA helicase DeaD
MDSQTPPDSSAAPHSATGFEPFGLHPSLLEALGALGYEEPTPVQREALPPLLEGRDVLGLAATGTGKTAAFALPMLQRLSAGKAAGTGAVSALVLVPTRELAVQVAEAVHTYGRKLGVSVLPVYGGTDIVSQVKRLKRGVDVVVATPGRALDHLRRGTLVLAQVQMVVLDEADEMLDMGFADDLEAILEAAPRERQTALFSATLPTHIGRIAEKHLKDPVRVRVNVASLAPGEMPRVRQVAYVVPRAHKRAALGRVLDVEAPSSAIIFCRTRTEVDELTESLGARGLRAMALHGGMSQEGRDRVLKRFKSKQVEVLVATDVAARGLHVEGLSHVVNYDLPNNPEAYVHRIGRTGRAGKEGMAISLVEPREHRYLRSLERATGRPVEVATVPTVADLRTRRLELTRASLAEALVEGNLDSYRSVVESLAAEHDPMDVAAAAVKLLQAHADGASEAEADIPTMIPSSRGGPDRGDRGERGPRSGPPGARRDGPRGAGREGREGGPPRRREGGPPGERGAEKAWERVPRGPGFPPRGAAPAARTGGEDTVTLFVGAGRDVGLRPADLVGAIANEAGLPSRDIGAIEIADGYSRVEVPASAAGQVIDALKTTTLRGRKVTVRKDNAR